jgi:hypothetical protein
VIPFGCGVAALGLSVSGYKIFLIEAQPRCVLCELWGSKPFINKKAMGRLPMAFRMIADGSRGRSGHPKSDGWAQLLVLRLFAQLFSSFLLEDLHRFFPSLKIRIYFTRVGIPVNKKLRRTVIIFLRSSPN